MINLQKIIYNLKNKPYKTAKMLESGFFVNDNHNIYYETYGNHKGTPVVILHGGPGMSISSSKRKFFNPKQYYIIQLDQRGCGKSTPSLATENNNTAALIEDMEKLRNKLNIKKWLVTGGSWGSTLALAYALSHKQCVLGLLINGVFLTSKEELDDTYTNKGPGAKLYPDRYSNFIEPLNKTEQKKPLAAYLKKIEKAENDDVRTDLYKRFNKWEWLLCCHNPDLDFIDKEVDSNGNIAELALLELHYLANEFFIDANEMLESLTYLSDIPTFIIQGRYDLICNPKTAYAVHNKIANSTLAFVNDGHSVSSMQTKRKFVEFSNKLLNIITKDKKA